MACMSCPEPASLAPVIWQPSWLSATGALFLPGQGAQIHGTAAQGPFEGAAGAVAHFTGTHDSAVVADISHRGMLSACGRGDIRARIGRRIPIKGMASPLVLG